MHLQKGLNPALVNSDPDNGNTMKLSQTQKNGDDTITIKDGSLFSSGLYDLKENANDVIKMGDGDDVFNTEKDAVVENTRIDLGNAGGEKKSRYTQYKWNCYNRYKIYKS